MVYTYWTTDQAKGGQGPYTPTDLCRSWPCSASAEKVVCLGVIFAAICEVKDRDQATSWSVPVSWQLNARATYEGSAQNNCTCCQTETEVADQTYFLQSQLCRHRTKQSEHWPYNPRRSAGWPLEYQSWGLWCDSTGKSGLQSSVLPLLRRTSYHQDFAVIYYLLNLILQYCSRRQRCVCVPWYWTKGLHYYASKKSTFTCSRTPFEYALAISNVTCLSLTCLHFHTACIQKSAFLLLLFLLHSSSSSFSS